MASFLQRRVIDPVKFALFGLMARQRPSVENLQAIPLRPDRTARPLGVRELTLGKTGERMVRNVTVPTLTPFRPADDVATGAAVIILPGGAFMALSVDNEGEGVARAHVEQGVAAFVLKYRTEIQTEKLPVALREIMDRIGAYAAAKAAEGPDAPYRSVWPTQPLAEEDAIAALKLVRLRAKEWCIDPARIGMLGFSAGGMAVTDVVTGQGGVRPDFVGVVYGNIDRPVPHGAPPAFIATAKDDPLLPESSARAVMDAWAASGAPATLRLYEKGGHGFGIKKQKTDSDRWFEDWMSWLGSIGVVSSQCQSALK